MDQAAGVLYRGSALRDQRSPRSNPETSNIPLECGDLSPLCLSNTALLSIGVRKQQAFHFNLKNSMPPGRGSEVTRGIFRMAVIWKLDSPVPLDAIVRCHR